MKKILNKSLKLFIIITVNVITIHMIGEILFRIIWNAKTADVSDELNLTYRYHEELGWFPIKNSLKEFKGSRLIHVRPKRSSSVIDITTIR
jgi:hypothetical protein